MRLSLLDYERDAASALDPMAQAYYAGGSGDEWTLRANRNAWEALPLRHRVLRGVGQRSTTTSILGTPISFPAFVAPTAFQRMAHPEGEIAMARGAGRAGTLMVVSTLSNTPLEDVARAATGPLWFQLYIYQDREITRSLVQRAEEAGFGAIVLTVDTPLLGNREGEARSGFRLPEGLEVGNLAGSPVSEVGAAPGASGLGAYAHRSLEADLTWEDLAWLRSLTSLPILVKGVVHPEDGRLAAESGAAGIIVSNHGGRQLDGSVPTATALPGVAAAVASAGTGAEVYVDGGIRRGTDVLRALALGARAVLIGRPVLWGLALEGEDGVAGVLEILRSEFDLALALAGIRNPEEARSGEAGLLG